jgi:hypothetical protein
MRSILPIMSYTDEYFCQPQNNCESTSRNFRIIFSHPPATHMQTWAHVKRPSSHTLHATHANAREFNVFSSFFFALERRKETVMMKSQYRCALPAAAVRRQLQGEHPSGALTTSTRRQAIVVAHSLPARGGRHAIVHQSTVTSGALHGNYAALQSTCSGHAYIIHAASSTLNSTSKFAT